MCGDGRGRVGRGGGAQTYTMWYSHRNSFRFEGVGDPHDGKANIVFVDGHVDHFLAEDINTNPDYDHLWKPAP